jgi:hypothetical protein
MLRSQYLLSGATKNSEKPQSGYLVSEPSFECKTSRMGSENAKSESCFTELNGMR